MVNMIRYYRRIRIQLINLGQFMLQLPLLLPVYYLVCSAVAGSFSAKRFFGRRLSSSMGVRQLVIAVEIPLRYHMSEQKRFLRHSPAEQKLQLQPDQERAVQSDHRALRAALTSAARVSGIDPTRNYKTFAPVTYYNFFTSTQHLEEYRVSIQESHEKFISSLFAIYYKILREAYDGRFR